MNASRAINYVMLMESAGNASSTNGMSPSTFSYSAETLKVKQDSGPGSDSDATTQLLLNMR